MSHSVEGNLPDGQRGYTNPSLPTTLISGPQVVFEHPKQDVVLSEQHGSFMQTTSKECLICNKHEQRINFEGGPAGFTLEIFPGRKAAYERALWNAQADMPVDNTLNLHRITLAGVPAVNTEQVEKRRRGLGGERAAKAVGLFSGCLALRALEFGVFSPVSAMHTHCATLTLHTLV